MPRLEAVGRRLLGAGAAGPLALVVAVALACGGGSPPPAAPSITAFSAEQDCITVARSTHLSAVFERGAGEIDHGVGQVTSGQRVPVSPQADTVYTLTVTGAGGDRVSRTVQVRVVPAPAVTAFTATPDAVDPGGTATLVATFASGGGVVDQGVGAVTSGVAFQVGPLAATTTFTVTVTNEAGDAASAAVTVTVRQALGAGRVTVVRRGASGALEPAAGIAIHRSDAATGAFLETRTTDDAGLVDFGDPGGARSTYTIVRSGPGGRTVVVSFVAVPAGALTLRLDALPDARDLVSSIEVQVSPSSWAAALVLPSGLVQLGESHTVPIDHRDLQDDGRLTLVGQTGGGEGGPLRCGLVLDAPVPAAGSSVTIPLDLDGGGLFFSASEAATASLSAHRKGVTFTSRDPNAWPRTSSGLESCLPLLPDVERWVVTGEAFGTRVQTTEGYALVDTVSGKRLRLVRPAGRLPESVDLDFQDLALEALTYGGGTVRATASGAVAEAIDLARVTVASGTVEWHLFAASAAPLALPDVPVLPAPPWQDGTAVQAELVAVRGHPGFDALWAEARDAGSLEEVLLGHDSASATGALSRFTPSYTIGFDGYSWERYGLITSSDGRIHCGASCATGWPAGTTVHLTATPNPGAGFWGWGGQCTSYGNATAIDVLVDHDILCNPSFGPASGNTFRLQVAEANWPALIRSDDGRIKCGTDTLGNHFDQCADSWFDSGYGLTLTVTPTTSTVVFDVAWHGDCSGTDWSTFVAMGGNMACSVELTPRAP